MKTITIITGSARPNSVNQKVVSYVQQQLAKQTDIVSRVADLQQLELPFYNEAMPPSADGFEVKNDKVRQWSELIATSDAVVFVAPEYNHGLSAIQKNAIDWLYKEWSGKPAAFIGYGWYAAAHSFAQFKEINTVIKLNLAEPMTGLQFTKDIDTEGEFIEGGAAETMTADTLNALVGKL